MTGGDFLAGWSAGLCSMFVIASGLCLWTARDMWIEEVPARRVAFVACVGGFLAALALWQGDASYRWIIGQWQANGYSATSFLWRGAATAFLFGMIGTTSWPRCGWRGLAAAAVAFLAVGASALWYAAVT